MDAATAQQIEATMKQVVSQQSPESVKEIVDAILQDGVTQDEVDEFRAMTIEAIDDPRTYPKYMQYLESIGLLTAEQIPDVYDAGFMLTMLGMAGVAQDYVNG